MFNILLKHIIIEQAIETAFNNIKNNFNTTSFTLPKTGDFIYIKFKDHKTKGITAINAHVHHSEYNNIVIMYYIGNECHATCMNAKDIIEWNIITSANNSALIQNTHKIILKPAGNLAHIGSKASDFFDGID